MATLTAKLTLVSTDISAQESFSLSSEKGLITTNPVVGLSTATVNTVGADNIIQPRTDGQTYYVYIRHTGKDSSGSTVTSTLNIENSGDVVFGKLAAEEFAFFPYGGHELALQLQASAGTIVAEYAYYTKG